MRPIEALVLLNTAATFVLAAESSRPRGVGPEFAKFYKSKETFVCIATPSVVLSADKVNDDYCDCPDGSDEPGTSACTYLSTLSPQQPVAGTIDGTSNVTIALPGYYCKNKGHQPSYVPFTVVNDGVCDYELCCDGSDEWAAVGGIKCPDECASMGREWKKKELEREKAAIAAGRRRAELVKEAADLKVAGQQNVDRLEKEIEELEAKVAEARKKYEEIERRERGKVSKGVSSKGSKVALLAKLARDRVEELREALLTVLDTREAARAKILELEIILSQFKTEYNPNFNDEGVKRAVKAWEDYAAKKDAGSDTDPTAEDRDFNEIAKPDGDTDGINWAEWEVEEEESDVDALYRIEEYLPVSVRDWIHGRLADLRVMLVENGILADNANSGTESKAVSAAREAFQTINDDLNVKQGQLGDHTRDLSKDYGPDDVFRALTGSCVSQDSGEYTYELCWMGKSTQKSKKGGANTGMGDFVRFDTVTVDEEVSADGKGLGRGNRLVMRYENGQHCWNGPNRQTTVVLACAEKDEIWKVIEEEKCLYRMEVGSPAACDRPKPQRGSKAGKDEL